MNGPRFDQQGWLPPSMNKLSIFTLAVLLVVPLAMYRLMRLRGKELLCKAPLGNMTL